MNGFWQCSVFLWWNSDPKSGSCGSAKWGIRVWHCHRILGYMHAPTLAIGGGENSALTPDSDPKLHLAPRFWPKIATRNLGARPQILYRTNFHKCRCSHILKRSRVIFKPHKWTNCAKSEPQCAQSLKARGHNQHHHKIFKHKVGVI